MIVAVFATTPVPWWWQVFCAPVLLLFFWYWLGFFRAAETLRSISLAENGSIIWHRDNAEQGQLLRTGLVSQWVLLVCWQDNTGRQYQRWLLADQFSEADYRTLARHIRQASWADKQHVNRS